MIDSRDVYNSIDVEVGGGNVYNNYVSEVGEGNVDDNKDSGLGDVYNGNDRGI